MSGSLVHLEEQVRHHVGLSYADVVDVDDYAASADQLLRTIRGDEQQQPS